MDENDLQEQLLRFDGRFTSRMTAAFQPLAQAEDPGLRAQAMNDELAYISAALDIAIGPSPALNLLDMVTLVALGRDAMSTSWRAKTTPEVARGIESAFDSALEDVRAMASTVLAPEMESDLFAIVREWQREHPNERDVVIVRLSQYTAPEFAGSASLAKRADGLFSRLRGATRAADSALMLGRRALFAAQRLPFLLRMHVEIATADALLTARRTMADATRESLPAVEQTVGNVSDKALLKLGLTGGAIAIVAAIAWLLARLAYRWLAE
jgi:hypothetical protein